MSGSAQLSDGDAAILRMFEAGSPRGLARAISRAEGGEGAALMGRVFERAGRAMTVGVTGPPGVGKSTLSSALVTMARRRGQSVGVVSVDPSSPFSRGAILGDRIRLSDHFTDPEVFIRSMASRGHLGGLAGATGDAVAFMDAFGKDVIVVETVGVGQSEIEIAELTDTTLVVLQPGSGDAVQLLKAGILEVADIFVVNKADHPMALQLRREIRNMLEMLTFTGWRPELIVTEARAGTGVEALWAGIERHAEFLRTSGELEFRRRAAFAHRVRALVLGELEPRIESQIAHLVREDAAALGDPYVAAATLLARLEQGVPREAAPPSPARKPAAVVKGL